MNNKSVRLQLLQYLHRYFDLKNSGSKNRKKKTADDVMNDVKEFGIIAKKEVDLRKELKDDLDIFMHAPGEEMMQRIQEKLEDYSNADEKAILMHVMKLLDNFEQEIDKQKKKQILIDIEDFVYAITSDEHLEVSWNLHTFLLECFFIYYSHNNQKAEIEYGINKTDDQKIEQSVLEKLTFLREVLKDEV